MNIYGPGVYTFNTGCPSGNPACTTAFTSKRYELTVPAGYLGARLLFDWSTSAGEDVVQLWKPNRSWEASGGELGNGGISTDPFCEAPFTNGGCDTKPNPNGNTRYTVWDAVSVDTPASTIRLSDGSIPCASCQPNEVNLYHGTKAIDGPATGFSLNFNLQGLTAPVPLPSAVWLFGSRLAGLLAAVRRKSRR